MRTISHLRPRANTFNAVFRVRSALAYAIHKFFQERGFVYVNTPIITSSDAEGAGEMFNVSSFDFNQIPKNSNFKDLDKNYYDYYKNGIICNEEKDKILNMIKIIEEYINSSYMTNGDE